MDASAKSTPSTPRRTVRRYLIARHGETNFNRERRIQGSLDGLCTLTPEGMSQAAALGVYVARRQAGEAADDEDDNDYGANGSSRTNGGGSVKTPSAAAAPPITRTWCSPLTRCRQTHAAVSGRCPSLPAPTIRADLREIEFREWQGILRSDIIERHPRQWNTFKKDPKSLRLNDGFAPVLDMWERASNNWIAIRSDASDSEDGLHTNSNEEGNDGDAIFIMTHGAMGQCMLLQSLGISVETYGKGRKYSFDNCECVELEWANGEDLARRWRRVHPATTQWQSARASRAMASGAGLRCGR